MILNLIYLLQKFIKFYVYEEFDRAVSDNLFNGHIYKINFTSGYIISDIIILNINILSL